MNLWRAFHCNFVEFNLMRQAVARACGGTFPSPLGTNRAWTAPDVPPHRMLGRDIFFDQPDDEGQIAPKDCREMLNFLYWAIPRVVRRWRVWVFQFAARCEGAVLAGESVFLGLPFPVAPR